LLSITEPDSEISHAYKNKKHVVESRRILLKEISLRFVTRPVASTSLNTLSFGIGLGYA